DDSPGAGSGSDTVVTPAPPTDGAPDTGGSTPASKKAGFILPDSASSARWEAFDRPYIQAACDEAGIECVIQNAEGDKNNMATIADQMIADGVGVLAIV